MGKATVGATHTTREAESRDNTSIHPAEDAPWTQPASLEAPPPRPGMVQRWIRVGSLGKDDAVNASRKFREGWKPRTADSVPPDFPIPRIDNGKFAGLIGVEGMVLCEMPVERNAQRNAYFASRRDRMTDAINQQLAQASQQAGGGFGRIVKEERSAPVREVAVSNED